jgi:c-di-AMP phosphodiesterase-like protein
MNSIHFLRLIVIIIVSIIVYYFYKHYNDKLKTPESIESFDTHYNRILNNNVNKNYIGIIKTMNEYKIK